MVVKKEISCTYFGVIFRMIMANKFLLYWAPISLLVFIIDSLSNLKVQVFFNKLLKDLFSNISGDENTEKSALLDTFYKTLLFLFIHYSTSSIIDYLKSIFSLFVYRTFLKESVSDILGFEYTAFHNMGSGVIQESIIRSSKAARDSIPLILFEIPQSIVSIIGISIEIYRMMTREYLYMFAILCILSFLFSFSIGNFTYKKERHILSLFNKTLSPITDILSNFDVLLAFNKEDQELKNYEKTLSPFVSTTKLYYFKKHALLLIQKIFLFSPQAFIFYSAINGKDIWSEYALKNKIPPANNYNSLFISFRKLVLSTRNSIFIIIKKSVEVKNDLAFCKSEKFVSVYKSDFKEAIKLQNVHFYAGNNLILKNQTFDIPKGMKFAVTGTNGGGKTVFFKTLLKFFKNEGSIYIDDRLLSDLSDVNIRDLISYAPQDPHIFNNTVVYNLCYGLKEEPDISEIYKICQVYGVHEFFKGMKEGYLTRAGERGKYLSGGQKQRISIMRALINNAPIIIMDEPTANIDRTSEMELIDKILELNPEKTIIFIVHNYELLGKFDKILYFTKEGITAFESKDSFINRDMTSIPIKSDVRINDERSDADN